MPPGGRSSWSPHELLNVRFDGTCSADPSSTLSSSAACTWLKAGIERRWVSGIRLDGETAISPLHRCSRLKGHHPSRPLRLQRIFQWHLCSSCLRLDSIQLQRCCACACRGASPPSSSPWRALADAIRNLAKSQTPFPRKQEVTHNTYAVHITGEAKATGSQEAQERPLGKANLDLPLRHWVGL